MLRLARENPGGGSRIGEFSPETFEAEWLGGASGPAVGARFRGHVRRNGRGPVYWTVCTVTACEPGRAFAFAVGGPGGRILNTWAYRLAPVAGGGTDVTESFELPATPVTRLYWDDRRRSARPHQRRRHAGHAGEDQDHGRIGRAR